jgi:hypothetical protein
MLAAELVEPERFLTHWAKEKDVSPHVRNLMGFLALAELAGAVKACPTGTRFVTGEGPCDLDLDALHDAAVAALKASRKRSKCHADTGGQA